MSLNLLVIGASKYLKNFSYRVDKTWNITVIDIDKNKIDKLKEQFPNVKFIEGDGSSLYILENCDIEKKNVIVISTKDDELNLVIIKILKKRFSVKKIIAILNDEDNLDKYQQYGVDTININSISSTFLINKLESRTSIATSIGLGKGEIAEVRVTSSSHILGKSLKEIHPQEWVVGAVYRDNKLILPHGDTVFKENDKVLIISDPRHINSIAEYVSIGNYRFPLQFGNNLLTILYPIKKWKTIVDETIYNLDTFFARGADFIIIKDYIKGDNEKIISNIKSYIDKKGESRNLKVIEVEDFKSFIDKYQNGDYGVVIMGDEKFSIFNKFGKKNITYHIIKKIEIPLLVAKGKYPYKNVLISDQEPESYLKGVEMGINIGKKNGANLTKVLVKKPDFLADGDSEEIDSFLCCFQDDIKCLCNIYDVEVKKVEVKGNPIREISNIGKKHDLVILTQKQFQQSTLLYPYENQYILHKSLSSVIIYSY